MKGSRRNRVPCFVPGPHPAKACCTCQSVPDYVRQRQVQLVKPVWRLNLPRSLAGCLLRGRYGSNCPLENEVRRTTQQRASLHVSSCSSWLNIFLVPARGRTVPSVATNRVNQWNLCPIHFFSRISLGEEGTINSMPDLNCSICFEHRASSIEDREWLSA